jgi:putative ATP-dependent endonuclease of OLD family
MRIVQVAIDNYRNLGGTKLTFNENINFLVGENDLGKSNLLDMLDKLFNRRGFYEGDFFDKTRQIAVELSMILSEVERGAFEDLFDPSPSNRINVVAKQEGPDDDIRYFHKESEEEIHYTRFRCVNFIKYDSLRTPREELTFHRGRGVGKFLSYLVSKFLSENPETPEGGFVNAQSVEPIVHYINQQLARIRLLRELMISACMEEELTDLVYRILAIRDSKGFDIQRTGYGAQFSLLIALSILEKLMQLVENRRREECIFAHDGKRSISLIVGLDEPEIHLHPYMQRRLVRCISDLLQNKDEEFSTLVKQLFDIDSMDGQGILATHSPNILLNSHKYVVRFYRSWILL